MVLQSVPSTYEVTSLSVTVFALLIPSVAFLVSLTRGADEMVALKFIPIADYPIDLESSAAFTGFLSIIGALVAIYIDMMVITLLTFGFSVSSSVMMVVNVFFVLWVIGTVGMLSLRVWKSDILINTSPSDGSVESIRGVE